MTGGETTAIDRPVLVTGGAGFIGSNFVHHMIERGYPVVTLDALNLMPEIEPIFRSSKTIHSMFLLKAPFWTASS